MRVKKNLLDRIDGYKEDLMLLFIKKNVYFILIAVFLMIACRSSKHNKEGVEAALNYYDHLVKNLDADSIALLYTPDGKMGDMAKGRDSIRAFLATFKNIEVLSQHSTSDTIFISNDIAIQKGIYLQSDVISGRDTVRVKGEYKATWQWTNNDWLIKSMETKPLDMKTK